jgi:type IV pilus assembly protein PilB
MFETHDNAILELCREQQLIAPAELEAADDEHKATGKPLADVLIELGYITRSDLIKKIAEQLGLPYMEELPVIPGEVVNSMDGDLARAYNVLPLRFDGQTLEVVASDPFNPNTAADLSFAIGRSVRLVLSDPIRVEALVKLHYGEDVSTLEDLLHDLSGDKKVGATTGAEEVSEKDLAAMAGQTPIVKFVNLVLNQAIRDKASDIHFEPFENEFKIRYRIDGALYEMSPPPKQLAVPITSRVKVLANLNIAERRVPQDGRIKLTIANRAVDLRVSTLPTQFGESVVLRVLDQSAMQLDLTQLGLPTDIYEGINEIIRRPNGIFIVTGPTGCGKTTTLYSALRVINSPDLKLLTAEDPVEYEIEGIMQVPVNHTVGLTFAAALRSFLRQDPDVIMVGEVRDLETAQIAIQASLTGHLVLSTLHTNDAPGTISRLIDMGLEPFLLASSVEAVLSQRLLRRVCPKCRTPFEPSESLLQQLRVDPVDIGNREFFYGKGCEYCSNSGYRGRLGIYEWLRMTEGVRDLVVQKAPTLVIKQKALEQGMRTLRDDGLRAIFEGLTSIEEVVKYT